MGFLSWPKKAQQSEIADSSLWSVLDSLGDVVLVLDPQLRITLINQSWQNITQVPVVDSLNQPFADFLHPEDLPSWQNTIKTVQDKGSALIWLRLLCTDGDIRWCEMRLQPVSKDNPYPLSATLCDITPQVRNEQVKEAGYRSLQSLVNRLPAMLYRSRNNISWSMEYVNHGCKALTGYSPEQLLNQSEICLGTMIHPEDRDYVWEHVQVALQMHAGFDLHYRLIQATGREIRVRDKGQGLYSDSDMVLGVEGIILQEE